MFKPFVLTIATVALLGLSASTLADDDRHRRHHSGGHYGGHYGPPHGYGPPGHRGYGKHYGRKHHRDDGLSDGVKIAAGALVLGTIIYAINQNQQHRAHTSPPAPPPPPSHWYRIDGNGDCVEVRLNSRGQEVWTYVDPAYCH